MFLRLFVANPGWVLRRPREFLTELLDTALSLMQQAPPGQPDVLEMVATATVQLLHAQPALLDALPAQVRRRRGRGVVLCSLTLFSPLLFFQNTAVSNQVTCV